MHCVDHDARRAEIEAELTDTQRRALEEDCRVFGVVRTGWRTVPVLRIKYESTALATKALRIMRHEERAWTDALLRACVALDLEFEAARKRLGVWRSVDRQLPRSEDSSGT
jgi:hypothetical protein